jgi:DNA topoisomerase VI subunit B
MQQNDSVKHIVENFNLYGLCDKRSALLQCFKELFENSIDACKYEGKASDTNKRTISVKVTNNSDQGTILLEAIDNGCGIEDPLNVLKCFTSNKTAKTLDNHLTTGRFGMGLSVCFVYSQKHTTIPLRLITKCTNKLSAIVANYTLDEKDNPVCLQSMQAQSIAKSEFISGTKVAIHLPHCKIISGNTMLTLFLFQKHFDQKPHKNFF